MEHDPIQQFFGEALGGTGDIKTGARPSPIKADPEVR